MSTQSSFHQGISGVLAGAFLCLVFAGEGHAAAPCAVPDRRHATIQSAVNDTACSEINVAAGVYSEQLTLNRTGGIIIRGVGAGRTIIKSPATRTRSLVLTGFLPLYSYVVQVRPGTQATLSNLTIDGGGNARCSERYFGIRFTSASGTLDHVVVENVRGSGSDFACANIIGVAVTSETGSSAVASSLTLNGSTIRSFQQTGLLANGPKATLRVSDTVLHGAGAQGSLAQTGIQLSAGASGTVDRATLTDLTFTGDPCKGVGTAVQLASAGTSSITSAVVITADRGILLSKNTLGKMTVSGSRFVETLQGILSTDNGSGLVHIDKNSFITTKRSAAATVATCFAESGDAIAVRNESASIVTANSAAASARCAIELLTGTSNLDVGKNQAVRSARADIEDAGTGNRLSQNLCTTSTPSGLCAGTP